jgi:hypothetical protein
MSELSEADAAWLAKVASNVASLNAGRIAPAWREAVRRQEEEARSAFGDEIVDEAFSLARGPIEPEVDDTPFQSAPKFMYGSAVETAVFVLFAAIVLAFTLPLWTHLGLH